MFKARDPKSWQRNFRYHFRLEFVSWISYSSTFFTMLLLVWKADAWLKQNMSCWSVNSFDFLLENCTRAEALVQFFQRKIERINRPTRHVLLQICHIKVWTQLPATFSNAYSCIKSSCSWTGFLGVGLVKSHCHVVWLSEPASRMILDDD